MAIQIVRLGSARGRREGLRIGTVRRPPRGVKRELIAARNFYDAWLPELAPSDAALRAFMADSGEKAWVKLARRYRKEMAAPEKQRLLRLLAKVSEATPISVGCYCADPSRCHRSILAELLETAGAQVRIEPSP